MIEKMSKYSFILLNEDTPAFLERIQELGVMDILRSSKAVDEYSEERIAELDTLKKRIDFLKGGSLNGDGEYDKLQSELLEEKRILTELEPWGEMDREKLSALAENGITLSYYCCPSKAFVQSWPQTYALEKVCIRDGKTWFVIASRAEDHVDIAATELTLPSCTLAEAENNASLARKRLDERAAAITEERKGVDALEKQYAGMVAALDLYLAKESAEKTGDRMIDVITGFVPSDQDEMMVKELDRLGVFYLKEDAKKDDEPPIRLRNNRFVRMFEVLTDMYGRPAYDGFDPTPYISIFFLLFFAMCIGDAGYGIVLFVVGMLLCRVKSFSSLAPLIMTLGLATVVVGIFFHTFFSIDIAGWEWIPECVRKCMVPAKIAGYDGTMVLALLVGVIHICLALIVKTVCATRNKGLSGSLSIWGWTLLIVGGVITGGIALAGVIEARVVRIIIIVLGCVSAAGIFLLNDLHRNPLLNIGAGLWETYNTATGLLGDVLSYLRLYALGLAGAMLGFAFNDLAGMVLGDGGVRWVPFVLIVVVGHTLNIAMAALGAFVHPLRLNFLEFFKNSDYDGSGRNYMPLKK